MYIREACVFKYAECVEQLNTFRLFVLLKKVTKTLSITLSTLFLYISCFTII